MLLQPGQVGHDLSLDLGGDLLAVIIVPGTGFGGNGKALRHRHSGIGKKEKGGGWEKRG